MVDAPDLGLTVFAVGIGDQNFGAGGRWRVIGLGAKAFTRVDFVARQEHFCVLRRRTMSRLA